MSMFQPQKGCFWWFRGSNFTHLKDSGRPIMTFCPRGGPSSFATWMHRSCVESHGRPSPPLVFRWEAAHTPQKRSRSKNPQSHEGLVQMSFRFHECWVSGDFRDTALCKPYLVHLSVVVGYNKEHFLLRVPFLRGRWTILTEFFTRSYSRTCESQQHHVKDDFKLETCRVTGNNVGFS